MQIPILQGIYTDTAPDIRTSYPKNLIAIPKQSGISAGYLRPHDGLVEFVATNDIDRGGINWNGTLYRVIGSKLVKVASNGIITIIGNVGNDNINVAFTYSFDRLSVASNNNLFYYDGSALTQVTDTDLGNVLDVVWVDGYFMTTDGEYLVVTELSDPTSVNPLKYGSSEANPDPIVALKKIQNEIYAINRHTIEVFDNVGGTTFPFARVESAQIDRGCVGTKACCEYLNVIAFIGSRLNESVGVWLGINSSSTKISTKEIDRLLLEYSEEVLAEVLVESRVDKSHQFLYIHLPDKTLVYDGAASQALGASVWSILDSNGEYRANNFTWCYDKWIFGDPTSNKLGYLDDSLSTHFGDVIEWEFNTGIFYNESRGAILHQVELVGFNGNSTEGNISTNYSLDGVNYTTPISIDITKRLVWFQQGMMQDKRIQRFSGTAHLNLVRLEVQIEPLYV